MSISTVLRSFERNLLKITIFCLFCSDTLQVLMLVCPAVSELRFYGCCHPCLILYLCCRDLYVVGALVCPASVEKLLPQRQTNHQHLNQVISRREGSLGFNSGREGTLGCLLHQSKKFYDNVFLFVSLKTFGTFIWEFLLVGSFSGVFKRLTTALHCL